jgi:hypothetical protein
LLEIWQDSLWTNFSLDRYTYNSSGQCIIDIYNLWQNRGWVNNSLCTYTYDANGNQLAAMGELWQNNQWTTGRYTITYDSSGLRLRLLNEQLQNSQWTNSNLYIYTYDPKKNLTSFSSKIWQDSTWISSDNELDISNSLHDFGFGGYYVSIVYKTTNVTGISAGKPVVPKGFSLSQNYPNPFNPSTVITFSVGTYGHTSLRVYDLLGREVATLVDGMKSTGNYTVTLNAVNLPSGVYFYRFQSGTYSNTKKLLLLK